MTFSRFAVFMNEISTTRAVSCSWSKCPAARAHTSSLTPPPASAIRVPCSAGSSAARSGPVKTVASRHAATRCRRTALSPAAAASLLCMSMQTAQPLIRLTRSATSSCVAAGSGESLRILPAAMKCLRTLPAVGSAK